jgi:hypothetical protein
MWPNPSKSAGTSGNRASTYSGDRTGYGYGYNRWGNSNNYLNLNNI